uniref:Uncharacterized protein n=1 Tax=Anguilla anguilla TaxID=7936 RepID=A0A0E9SJG5_ANGAN
MSKTAVHCETIPLSYGGFYHSTKSTIHCQNAPLIPACLIKYAFCCSCEFIGFLSSYTCDLKSRDEYEPKL